MRLRVATLHSPMPADAVRRTLEGAARHGFAFVGKSDALAFELRGSGESRNAFQPVIRGTIRPLERGSEVRLVFGLNPVIAVLTAVWFCGIAAPGWKALWREPSWPALLLLLLLGAFGLVLVGGGFYPDAKKAERAISGLIQGRRVKT